jgi:translocation and assembly module TamB
LNSGLRLLQWLLALAAATLVGAGLLAGGLWMWSGSMGSLATASQWASLLAPRLLAPGQVLEIEGGAGSLRAGGSFAVLRWHQDGLSIEAMDVQIAWNLPALLRGHLQLGQLHIGKLHVQSTSSASEPLQSLELPVQVDVAFTVDALEFVGSPAWQASALQGRYVFDGVAHAWELQSARFADGSYSARGRLQAAAPMALTAQLGGTVPMALPGGGHAVTLQADLQARGNLSGLQAALDVSGSLQQAGGAGGGGDAGGGGPRASVQATLAPWRPQPVDRAQARWSGLDLAALWPHFPRTLLTGELSVLPDGTDWKAQASLQNALSGPLDKQRLPVQSAQAALRYRQPIVEGAVGAQGNVPGDAQAPRAGQGQWVLERLQATGAGGSVQAQGRWVAATTSAEAGNWNVTATLSDVRTALVDTRLAAVTLRGQGVAHNTRQGVAFTIDVTGAAQSEFALQARGQWESPAVMLDQLHLQTRDAALDGAGSYNTATLDARGKLAAKLPGAALDVEGLLGRTQGQGNASADVSDAAALSAWLSRQPWLDASTSQRLTQTALQGAVDLRATWRGGWQRNGHDLLIDASLRSDRLQSGRDTDASTPVRLRALQVNASGTLDALVLQGQGQADLAANTLDLNLRSRLAWLGGGRLDAWLDSAQLVARSSQRPGDWTLRLAQSVALHWRQTAANSALEVEGGSVVGTGPAPGAAELRWQPVSWAQVAARTTWQSRGTVSGVPLAWLEILGQTQLANLGLRGDLLFGGNWDASMGNALAVRAVLERTSGDLQLLSDDTRDGNTAEMLRAGLREARVVLQIDDNAVAAQMRWAADNAGTASAELTTRLTRQDGGWVWRPDAPLGGRIQANLPRVGVWSLLAPPGWRIQGTLDADASLSGNRADPNWSGTLAARDLSVRSVVDGIDFSQGNLQLRIQGQRIDIERFSLRGAGSSTGGDAGGVLQASGSLVWLPDTRRVRMELEAVAQGLRVSARADQRLVVSGKVSTRLDASRLTVRGALVADQALFVLSDDTAPTLGSDVTVAPSARSRRAAASASRKPTTATSAAPARKSPLRLDLDVTLDPGNDFQLSGRGLRARLAGQVHLTADGNIAGSVPRLGGELRTVSGTYKAYGQTLDIETGVLRFNGRYDNPALDVLALRPNLQQKVGVQIGGTVQLPVVRLYSDPELSDTDKLSWLLLGRAPSTTGGDNALLQQAALALVAGSGKSPTAGLLGAVGLDELSLGEASSTNADGSAGPAATTVKFGKRVSREFYVAYERTISSTLGTFYVFYDLSRRFTLRAESGQQTALDLIFTTRFD